MTLPATSRRVEENTSPQLNERIQERTNAEVARLETAEPDHLSERIKELDQEWDIERTLQLNASIIAFTGSMLGYTTQDRRFFFVPTVIFGFFLQHAVQGWCPPVPIFRRLGIRTQREIERERYALKVLRGDFDRMGRTSQQDLQGRIRSVLQAVDL